MYVQYDSEADALYVRLREPIGDVKSRAVDDARIVDYDAEDHVVGVELLDASHGIDLEGLPEAEAIAEAIRSFPQPLSV